MFIPFKVKPWILPRDVYMVEDRGNLLEYNDPEIPQFKKVWLVAAIVPNPRYRLYKETWSVVERCFVKRIYENKGVSYLESIPCNLFLLVREGELPIWWPDKYCEVIEIPQEVQDVETE